MVKILVVFLSASAELQSLVLALEQVSMRVNRTEPVGWVKSLARLYPRGQPRVSDFAHAERAEHVRLPTLQIELDRNPL